MKKRLIQAAAVAGIAGLLAAATGTPPPVPEIGVSALSDEHPSALLQAKLAGASWVRWRVVWSPRLEGWGWSDEVVASAERHGLKLYFTFWVKGPDAGAGDCSTVGLSAFRLHTRVMVARYRGRVAAWGVDNEPDGCDQTPAQYADRLEILWQTVRDLDPGAKVAGGDLAYEDLFAFKRSYLGALLNVLKTRTCWPCMDWLALHYYDDFRARSSPPGPQGKVAAARAELAARGSPDVPVVISEGGLPSAPTDQWTWRSEGAQAIGLRRFVAECQVARIPLCVIFRAGDGETDAFHDPGGYRFGLVRSDGSAKTALCELSTTLATLKLGMPVTYPGGPDRIGKR